MKHFNQMRKLCASWTLVVVGLMLSSLAYAVFEPSQLPDPSRRWAVSALVSGGYDDNVYTSSSDDPNKKSSGITVVEPKFYLNYPMDQTFIGLRYAYNATYYWDRTGSDAWDQSHIADFIASHRFTPRLQLDVTDSFRRGLQPELVDMSTGVPYIRQQNGDYYYNNLIGTLTYNLTRLWTLSVGMGWEYWSYDEATVATDNDRNIYSPNIGINYTVNPSTTIGLYFRESLVEYSTPGLNDARNSHTETVYLSLIHQFNPKLSGQINAGGGVTEFGDDHSSTSPYASGSLTYRYAPNGTVTVGSSYFLYTSDQYGYRSADTLATFLQLNHMITPKLAATLGGTYIRSEYGDPDPWLTPLGEPKSDAYRVNLGLNYAFTRWLSAELNYTYDRVSSQLGNSYDRNRVWVGVRVTY